MKPALLRWLILSSVLNLGVSQSIILLRPELTMQSDAEDLLHLAEKMERAEKHDQAIRIYNQIVTVAGHTDVAAKASHAIAKIHMRKKFDIFAARDELERTTKYEPAQAAQEARKDLQFLKRHWTSDGVPLTLWFQASEASRAGDHDRALAILRQISSDTNVGSLRAHAYYEAGRILTLQGRRQEAIQAYDAVQSEFPSDELAEKSRLQAGKLR